jgi:1-acyl-sn-glycerol-3-phosphate acyltransferase
LFFLARTLTHIAFRVVSRLNIEGAENVPRKGACLLVSNHLTALDPPLIYVSTSRWLQGLGALKYKNHPVMGPFMRVAGTVFIKRGEVDRKALTMALNVLGEGRALLVSVEGTRSLTGGLVEGKIGAAYLATRANVPVIPVVTWGAEEISRSAQRFKRIDVYVRFGEPFRLPEGKARTEQLTDYTDDIMTTLASMLPGAYRGIYADHPLTLEKLAAQGG